MRMQIKYFDADADPGSRNLFDPWSGMEKIRIPPHPPPPKDAPATYVAPGDQLPTLQ